MRDVQRLEPATSEEYQAEARAKPCYVKRFGRGDSALRHPGRLLHMYRRMRQYRAQSAERLWAKHSWAVIAFGALGVIVGGAGAAGTSARVQYGTFADMGPLMTFGLFGGLFALLGVGLAYTLLIAEAWRHSVCRLEIVERADPDDPEEATGVWELYTWRLAWLLESGRHFRGSRGESGIEQGSVTLLLPQGDRIEEIDFRHREVGWVIHEYDTEELCAWPRVPALPAYDLSRRRSREGWQGLDIWALPPELPAWTEVADRERLALFGLAQREGALTKASRRTPGIDPAMAVGWAGGAIMMVLGFLMLSSRSG